MLEVTQCKHDNLPVLGRKILRPLSGREGGGGGGVGLVRHEESVLDQVALQHGAP